jgi:hypothetical protein
MLGHVLLRTNLGRLPAPGTTAINDSRNTIDEVRTGNGAANVLTGGAGNDCCVVGTGDSTVELAR